MTLEELRIEADRLGYRLVPKNTYIKILPCRKCGKKGVEYWTKNRGEFCKCKGCGVESSVGRTHNEAKRLWNAEYGKVGE